MSTVALNDFIERSALLPSDLPHEGDCAGSLCSGCGHCLHSTAACTHECEPGMGCSSANDSDEVLFRQDAAKVAQALASALETLQRIIARTGDPAVLAAETTLEIRTTVAP